MPLSSQLYVIEHLEKLRVVPQSWVTETRKGSLLMASKKQVLGPWQLYPQSSTSLYLTAGARKG